MTEEGPGKMSGENVEENTEALEPGEQELLADLADADDAVHVPMTVVHKMPEGGGIEPEYCCRKPTSMVTADFLAQHFGKGRFRMTDYAWISGQGYRFRKGAGRRYVSISAGAAVLAQREAEQSKGTAPAAVGGPVDIQGAALTALVTTMQAQATASMNLAKSIAESRPAAVSEGPKWLSDLVPLVLGPLAKALIEKLLGDNKFDQALALAEKLKGPGMAEIAEQIKAYRVIAGDPSAQSREEPGVLSIVEKGIDAVRDFTKAAQAPSAPQPIRRLPPGPPAAAAPPAAPPQRAPVAAAPGSEGAPVHVDAAPVPDPPLWMNRPIVGLPRLLDSGMYLWVSPNDAAAKLIESASLEELDAFTKDRAEPEFISRTMGHLLARLTLTEPQHRWLLATIEALDDVEFTEDGGAEPDDGAAPADHA